ncbi:uncharacterized protein LOC104882625 isoform X1 [Vitis vinifera]|uniref:uncharacterized protein LOC104882625 isoform X1 n=3 Tax=Vitis vinifera TaxID=29760 RepID=UPI0008FEBB3F|nr:uncharacterized protein LOC104882625 isoform X1 [Vitis vinifera]|eukprot:XP_019072342.1 PREDICTED: uncharacterized protein LOC104882625 isoform X3 [Vitis vinifera]
MLGFYLLSTILHRSRSSSGWRPKKWAKLSKATVCQKCGDRGYYEALTYCTKCHTSAEHRYCLDKLPEKLDEVVTDWMCEGCAPRISKESPLSTPSSVPARTGDRLRLKKIVQVSHCRTRLSYKNEIPGSVTKTVVQRREHLRSAQATECRSRLKEKKSKPSLVTKAEVQSSEHSLSHQPCDAPCSKIHEKDQTLGKHGQSVSDDAGNFIEEAEFVKTNASEITTGEPSNMLEIICFESEQPMVDTNLSETYEKYQELGKQRKLVHEDQGNTREEAEPAKDTVSELAIIGPSNTPELDPSNVPEFSCFVHAQPVVDPIWRGSFSICNENFDSVNGLAAHLSSKACLKVCQQASLLPALLCPTMLPKFDVWPKSFQISQPSDDNIALYFFPENERDEKVFDRLVLDMVSHELAMQTVVENAELLVFASTELPLRHWRFHGKLYLWGVFRGKQVSSTSCQVDDRHLIPNSSKESVTSSNLANDAGIRKEKDTSMVTTWDSRSPLSPLSNSGSHGSGSL